MRDKTPAEIQQQNIINAQLGETKMTLKPHRWAAEIHAWADGQIIQCSHAGADWFDCNANVSPLWGSDNSEFRIKADVSYPTTSIGTHWLSRIYHGEDYETPSLTRVANAAIKQAIIDGQVKLP